MKIGEEVRKYMHGSPSNKAVAMAWLEQWRALKHEPLSDATVESRLSEVLKGKPEAVRFFFGGDRASVTMQVLSVPNGEREALQRLAVAAMGDGPSLVVDITPFAAAPADHDDESFAARGRRSTPPRTWAWLFEVVRKAFLSLPIPVQTVVLLTTGQYDELPRSFDDSGLRFEPIDGDVQPTLARHLKAGSICASETQVVPFERWLAVNLTGALDFDPPDWIDRLSAGGELDTLPQVERPIDLVAQAATGLDFDRHGLKGAKLRRVIRALTQGNDQELTNLLKDERWYQYGTGNAAKRAALAKHLGVRAAATEEEWATERGRHVTTATAESFQLRRAVALYGATPEAIRIGEEIHIFNPDGATRQRFGSALFSDTAVRFHEEKANAAELLAQVAEVASGVTSEAALDDPFLERTIEATGPAGVERLVFHHALLSLAVTKGFPMFTLGKSVDEWRPAMRRLINAAAVEPELQLQVEQPAESYNARRFFAPVAELERIRKTSQGLPQILPFADVTVGRREPLGLYTLNTTKGDRYNPHWFPSEAGAAAWTTAFEAVARVVRGRSSADKAHQQDFKPFVIPSERWDQADEIAALALEALDRCVDHSPARLLPVGDVLLDLGGGVLARIRVRPSSVKGSSSKVSVLQQVSIPRRNHSGAEGDLVFEPLIRMIPTHTATSAAYVTDVGPIVPRGVRLVGQGFAAEVSFRASALLGSAVLSRSGDWASVGLRSERQRDLDLPDNDFGD